MKLEDILTEIRKGRRKLDLSDCPENLTEDEYLRALEAIALYCSCSIHRVLKAKRVGKCVSLRQFEEWIAKTDAHIG